MSFIILGDTFTFPEGNAATNRVFTYAKGFIENGVSVHVICFRNDYRNDQSGETEGIKYYHPFAQSKRNRNFIIRRWHKFYKYVKTLQLLKEINKKDRIIAINTWTQFLTCEIFTVFVARCLQTKTISEHSEHPLRTYQKSRVKLICGEIRSFLGTILNDGIFCISQYLIDFYNVRGINRGRLFLVPSTVDSTRFESAYDPPLHYPYILYCGALTLTKDGVDILIESFARISGKYPEINLVLLGKGDSVQDEKALRDMTKVESLNERVIFLGQVSRTEVPAYLTNARVLTLSRPASIVADAGFPSKLTEYMATGLPVVVTSVGEIPAYLKHKENAFLAKPDNAEAFAKELEYVLDNYEYACGVGLKGKELTKTVFNYNFQAKRMIEFIHSL